MGRRKKSEIEAEKEEKGGFELGLSQETKNGIFGIVAGGLAVVSTLAFLGKAGVAGDYFSTISKSLFGWGMFLLPLSLGMLSGSFFKSISRKIHVSAILGTSLFVFSFLGIFYITAHGDFDAGVYRSGYLGLALGYPLFRFSGFIASSVILTLALVISVLLALDISLLSLFKRPLTEEEQLDKEATDHIIVKRGSEVLKSDEVSPMPTNLQPEARKEVAKPTKSDDEKDFIIKNTKTGNWILPPLHVLNNDKEKPHSGDINSNVAIIKRTLANFGIEVEMGEVSIGPTVTQYTLRPAVGVKLSRIIALQNDLSLALAAHPLRIEAPIPGKALVGIEMPNKKAAIVALRELLEGDDFAGSKSFLPLTLGRDVAGFPVVTALEKMPHLLIAGATGTGKSVVLNTILLSFLYKHSPENLKLILVDPKRVELSLYNGIPHLITPVITDTKKVVNALKWAVREMDRRYEQLSKTGSRDLLSYNTKQITAKEETMPYIVVVIDELADLMVQHGREVEGAIVRLAQMARAVGIHLIVSTQRPSVEVITGLIKANITSRIALQVASQIDSRTILDTSGAEKLLGRGDMLYQSGDTGAKMRRVQGALVTEKEVHDVVDFIKKQAEKTGITSDLVSQSSTIQAEEIISGGAVGGDEDVDDDLFGEAKEVVIQAGKASASLLQRRLRVGYARAARLLDILEEKGIIGPGEGAKPREVYVSKSYDDGSSAEPAGPFSQQSQSPDEI